MLVMLHPGKRAHSVINVRWLALKVLICEIYIRVVKRLWIMSAAAYLRGRTLTAREGRSVKSGNVVSFPPLGGEGSGVEFALKLYYIVLYRYNTFIYQLYILHAPEVRFYCPGPRIAGGEGPS